MVGGNWLRRRRGRRSRTTDEAEEAAQQDASGSRSIYLRGPASLPQRPILRDRRPLIRPDGERHVTLCSSFLFKIII